MTKPVLSICLITYNQANFVEQALQGIFDQQINCSYEIVARDDCSTDGTMRILQKWSSKLKNFKLLQADTNEGMHKNWENAISACSGEYIALIEGDDYWIDEKKLAKQIHTLENNDSLTGCFTNAKVVDESGIFNEYDYVSEDLNLYTADYFFNLDFNPIPTCTLLFRNNYFRGFPIEYYKSPFADWILHTILIQEGNYAFIPDCTSVYRQHSTGVWSGTSKIRQIKNVLKALNLIKRIVKKSNHKLLVAKSIRKQLDKALYYHRENNFHIEYLRTWIQLKLS